MDVATNLCIAIAWLVDITQLCFHRFDHPLLSYIVMTVFCLIDCNGNFINLMVSDDVIYFFIFYSFTQLYFCIFTGILMNRLQYEHSKQANQYLIIVVISCHSVVPKNH